MIKLCEVPSFFSCLLYTARALLPSSLIIFLRMFCGSCTFLSASYLISPTLLFCSKVWFFFLLESLCIYFEAMQKIAVNDFPSLSSQLRHVYIDNDGKNGCCLSCGVGWLLCSCICFSDATGICVLMLSQLCSNLVQSVVQARLQRGFFAFR